MLNYILIAMYIVHVHYYNINSYYIFLQSKYKITFFTNSPNLLQYEK